MQWKGGAPLTDNGSQCHWNREFLPANGRIIGRADKEKSVATEKSLFQNGSNAAPYYSASRPKHDFGHPYNLVG